MDKLAFNKYWTLLPDYIPPQKGRFNLLVLLMLFAIALRVVNPQVMHNFIDAALAQQAEQTLFRAALLFISIAILHQLVSVTYLGATVASSPRVSWISSSRPAPRCASW